PTDFGVRNSDSLIDSMDWKRRHGVDFGVAHRANAASGVHQVLGFGELAHHGVNFVLTDAQLVFDLGDENGGIRSLAHVSEALPSSCPAKTCFSCDATPFTSDIAI